MNIMITKRDHDYIVVDIRADSFLKVIIQVIANEHVRNVRKFFEFDLLKRTW